MKGYKDHKLDYVPTKCNCYIFSDVGKQGSDVTHEHFILKFKNSVCIQNYVGIEDNDENQRYYF